MTDSQNNPPLPPSRPPLDEQVARELTSPPAEAALSQPSPTPPPQLTPEQRYAHLPPTLRVPWTWLDIFLLVLFSIAVPLVLSIGFAIVYGLTGHDLRNLSVASPSIIYVGVLLQAILDAIILAYMLGLMRWRYHTPPWRALGWEPLPDGKFSRGSMVMGLIFGGVVLSLAVAAASQLFPQKSELPVEQILHDHRAAILFMVMAVLVAPVVEETFFRGFLYPVAARSFGVPAGIVVTGTLFGLLHAGQLSGAPWLVVLIIFVGCVFTWIRVKTNTVLASFIVHTAYNGIQVIGLLVATHGLTKSVPHM